MGNRVRCRKRRVDINYYNLRETLIKWLSGLSLIAGPDRLYFESHVVQFGINDPTEAWRTMYGIFLINDAGETLASIGWENLRGDSSLFGGFLSAVQMFIKKISGTEIDELRFGDLKLLIGRAHENYVVTLHAFDDPNAEEQNRRVIELITEDNEVRLDDGFLGLVNEMVTQEEVDVEKIRSGVRSWVSGDLDEAKKAARDWGSKVF